MRVVFLGGWFLGKMAILGAVDENTNKDVMYELCLRMLFMGKRSFVGT